MCTPIDPMPTWDQRQPWTVGLIDMFKHPTCADPIWSPKTDDEVMKRKAFLQEFGVDPNIVYVADGAITIDGTDLPALQMAVLGVLLVRRISVKRFYQLTYWLVFLLALKLIYDGAMGVFFTAHVA